jgi:hypothetical protein
MTKATPASAAAPTEDLGREMASIRAEAQAVLTQPTQAEQVQQARGTWWSATNAMTMSAAVLAFGLLVLVLATYLIRFGKSAEAVLRIYGTVLIIVVAVFLVVAGYNSEQIAPVTGLLGTIVGYLLGKETSRPSGAADPSSQSPVAQPSSSKDT